MKNRKDCEEYFDGFCLQHIGEGRIWDCTAPNKNIRLKITEDKIYNNCPYPKLDKK
jgi:hypothetical protein